jgi:transposase
MRANDARGLDHTTLEAMRERAVRSVHDGESPEVVAGVLGINRSTIYGWLAQYRRGGWGALKAKPLFGRPPPFVRHRLKDRARDCEVLSICEFKPCVNVFPIEIDLLVTIAQPHKP